MSFKNTLCNTCLGCNKIEYNNFKGAYECDNYRDSRKRESYIDNICKKYYKQSRVGDSYRTNKDQ